MQRVNLAWFSQLGIALKPLIALGSVEKPTFDQFVEVHTARGFLDGLADNQVSHLQLRASREPLRILLAEIDKVFEPGTDWEKALNDRKFTISYYASQLDPLLQGELSVQNAYLVWPKRAYDIELLIQDATRLFSQEARDALSPIERYDIGEAGKCLAFEVPTAALFHAFRAADSVLRRYYRSITNSDPKPKMRNWGAYIKTLRACHANEKILSALEQLKELHRNPVIHPEAQINIEEALSFVGITESVISAMLSEMHQRSAANALASLAAATAAIPPAPMPELLPAPDDEQPG